MVERIIVLVAFTLMWGANAHAIIINSVSAGVQCTAAGDTCFDLRVVSDPSFNSISWHTAGENAIFLGGMLATPETMEENDILLSLLVGASMNPWGNVQFGGISVGGWTGVSHDGVGWVNLDGSNSLATTNNVYPWYVSEPNGPLPSDAFVGFVNVTTPNTFGLPAGTGWADLKDFSSFFLTPSFFVEVPEPTTLLLMGMGLAGLGFARRRRLNA